MGIEVQEHQLRPPSYGTASASTSETHSRLKEPITPATVGAFEDELDDELVRRVEQDLGEEMHQMGYEPTTHG